MNHIIFSAADYGMLDCITDGCLKAFRFGLLKTITFITNNQSAFRAAEALKEFPDISIGQEINFVTGTPICDPLKIPSLVKEDGNFIPSFIRHQMGKEGRNFSYEDALKECEAQVSRFIELTGKKPLWLSGHSFGSRNTRKAIADTARRYGIVCAATDHRDLHATKGYIATGQANKGSFSIDVQSGINAVEKILRNELDILGHEWVSCATHAGYLDEELMKASTFNVIRAKELEALTSQKVRDWLHDHDFEIVGMKEFMDSHSYDLEESYEKFVAPRPGWSE